MTVRKIAIANVAGAGDIVLHVAARQASGLSVSKRGRRVEKPMVTNQSVSNQRS